MITFIKANILESNEILKMQKEAFMPLFDKYKDYKTSPAMETLEDIKRKFSQEGSYYYFIEFNNLKIGAIRVVEKEFTCRIAPMFILPFYLGKGFAQKSIIEIEKLFPLAKTWILDTIKQESKLCHLYEKMGYKVTGKIENIQLGLDIVYYSKSV